MAAGLGFKDFVTGEVLTAADVDGYLMQGVWVFASAAARDAAVTSPQEGNFAYLKDTNVTTYYTGSAWANLDTTGMTNPMTTTGDIIYSSPGSTPVRLGIGSTGNVLTVASGVPSWAAPAAAGGSNWSLVNAGGTALTGASTITVSGISGADQLFIIVESASAGASSAITWRLNADSGANYGYFGIEQTTSSLSGTSATADTSVFMTVASNNQASRIYGTALITGTNSAGVKMYQGSAGSTANGGTGQTSFVAGGYYTGTSTISSFSLISSVGNFDQGTLYVYKTA